MHAARQTSPVKPKVRNKTTARACKTLPGNSRNAEGKGPEGAKGLILILCKQTFTQT